MSQATIIQETMIKQTIAYYMLWFQYVFPLLYGYSN